ncbi:MAG: TonB family protein [Rhodothalassiaceae bacterium]
MLKKRLAVLAIGGAALAALTPAFGNDLQKWRKDVVKTVVSNRIYPDSAISRGIEGVAKVRISIDRSGNITGFEVMQPTGQEILDREIPKFIDRINPLPAPPDALPDDKLTFVFPLVWKLE